LQARRSSRSRILGEHRRARCDCSAGRAITTFQRPLIPPRRSPTSRGSSRCCSYVQQWAYLSRWKPGSKSPRWPENRSGPCRGASNLAGRSKWVNRGSPVMDPPLKTECGDTRSAEPLNPRRRPMSTLLHWNLSTLNSPGSSPDISHKKMHRGAESAKVLLREGLSEDSRAPR
jgi:hypothetical protein